MTDWESIIKAAHDAAKAAVIAEVEREPENPHAFDCGFAWVTIEGVGPLARFARAQVARIEREHEPGTFPYNVGKRVYGDKGYPRGWQWWCPGEFRGQSVRIHRKGAEAFANALAPHGIRAVVGSRLD